MKHPLLNVVTSLSLLLCAATVALWARSYRNCDALVRPAGPGDWLCVTSEFGVLVFEVEGPVRGAVLPGWEYFESPLPRRWPVRSARLGFEAYQGQVTHFVRLPPSGVRGVTIPHWCAALAFAVLPGWRFVQYRGAIGRRRRSEAGLCAACGYDLRATPLVCPECGRGAVVTCS